MSKYFFVDVKVEKSALEDLEGGGDGEEAGGAIERLQKLIQPNQVVKAINTFVQGRKGDAEARPAAKFMQMEEEGSGEVEKKKPSEEKLFWERMANVISPSTWSTWDHLESSLKSYNTLLESRASGISNVNDLGEQNGKLKELLNQYLGSRINDELIVPPTDTIKLGK